MKDNMQCILCGGSWELGDTIRVIFRNDEETSYNVNNQVNKKGSMFRGNRFGERIIYELP